LDVLHALEKFTRMIGEVKSKKNVDNFGDFEFHVGGLGMLQEELFLFYFENLL